MASFGSSRTDHLSARCHFPTFRQVIMGAADLIFSQFGIWSVNSTTHNVYLLVFYFAACVVQATFMVRSKSRDRSFSCELVDLSENQELTFRCNFAPIQTCRRLSSLRFVCSAFRGSRGFRSRHGRPKWILFSSASVSSFTYVCVLHTNFHQQPSAAPSVIITRTQVYRHKGVQVVNFVHRLLVCDCSW